MNIRILDSWLREHLDTKATSSQIAEILSLTSVSVEKLEPLGKDYLYDIEITTNRPDLMSVVGLAREAAVALASEGTPAKFIEKKMHEPEKLPVKFPVEVINDPKLVHRICAVVLSVRLDKSPQLIRDRLEATDIRSINNVVDVTNYVMREVGHPLHAFDFDKLTTKKMVIREAKKGEKITTLDKKEHVLNGGEIVADDGSGILIDLLGIMGLHNTSVSDGTQKVLLFADNNDKHKIRRASMELGTRTDAAILNEKGVDLNLTHNAIVRGIELLEQIADAKQESEILDVYPKSVEVKPIDITFEKINQVIGVNVPEKKVLEILKGLDFNVEQKKDTLTVTPPSNRSEDIQIPEDIVEEVARIYGYHKLPSILPPVSETLPLNVSQNPFYWEKKTRDALKYWGFTEVYTYSLVLEDMLEVAASDAVKIENPLGSEFAYLRTTLIPSLLQAVRENKSINNMQIFELANVYYKNPSDLPSEITFLSGVIRKDEVSFFKVKGIIEALFDSLGIKKYEFKKTESGGAGADIYVWGKKIGEIEILDRNLIDFEMNFSDLLKYTSIKKVYKPVSKFPPAFEDLRVIIDPNIEYAKIVSVIKTASNLVADVELLDTYQDKKTFRVTYQSKDKNLTSSEISDSREKIINSLKKDLRAEIA